MPAQKKHPSTRARANKASTAANLIRGTGTTRHVPELPDHPSAYWHQVTMRWWTDLWTSPLPDAWENFDLTGLFSVALVFNDQWIAVTAKERKEASGEYRLQRKDFFIAPYDRLRGEIVMEDAEAAKDRGAARRGRQGTKQPKATEDPRLKLVQ